MISYEKTYYNIINLVIPLLHVYSTQIISFFKYSSRNCCSFFRFRPNVGHAIRNRWNQVVSCDLQRASVCENVDCLPIALASGLLCSIGEHKGRHASPCILRGAQTSCSMTAKESKREKKEKKWSETSPQGD